MNAKVGDVGLLLQLKFMYFLISEKVSSRMEGKYPGGQSAGNIQAFRSVKMQSCNVHVDMGVRFNEREI